MKLKHDFAFNAPVIFLEDVDGIYNMASVLK
jgi:hypothetical protein